MAIMAGRVAVAGATTIANVLAGDIFEFLRANSTIKAGWVTTFGAVAQDLTATLMIGDAITVQNSPVAPENGAIGNGVEINRDLKYVDAGRAGQRVTLSVTNTTAATARDFEWYVLIA